MTVQDYLLKFRKISSLESLEKLYDHLNYTLTYTLTDDQELINMYRAADHRRAELVSGGRLFDLGQVPKSVWRYVQ
ncbi:transcription modulator YdgT [Escherichia coli]